MSALWGGRFSEGLKKSVLDYTTSLAVDQRLWQADIAGSQAHVRMLAQVGVISLMDSRAIIAGLDQVGAKIFASFQSGLNPFSTDAEDVHSEIERMLKLEIGEIAGRLHTGRSRNDQVTTTVRIHLKSELKTWQTQIRELQKVMVAIAEKHLDSLLPGLTHTQHAQPVSLAHHMMAYVAMLSRDWERVAQIAQRMNVLPLGAAALAGSPYPLDRERVAQDLGFDSVCENSLDAVSDRDFVVEILSAASLTMSHLSRLSEELVLWSTPEFGFVELADSVTTGSSIMPQKKNPDVAELMRARSARPVAALTGCLMMLKALPLAYNRDLQEDKGYLWEGMDVTLSSLELMKVMLENASFKTDRMAAALHGDFSNATDLADYLVGKGMPFRQAHEVVGVIVRSCIGNRIALEDLTLPQLKMFSNHFESDVIAKLKHQAVVDARKTTGGTAKVAVMKQIQRYGVLFC